MISIKYKIISIIKIYKTNDTGEAKMKTIILVIFILLANTAVAENAPSCPDRGADPMTFCLPGMTWDQNLKACVGMV